MQHLSIGQLTYVYSKSICAICGNEIEFVKEVARYLGVKKATNGELVELYEFTRTRYCPGCAEPFNSVHWPVGNTVRYDWPPEHVDFTSCN